MIASKLRTEKHTIPRPENIQSWGHDFSNMPPFTFADLYMQLIDSEKYTAENFKSFKGLLGYQLFSDGQVQDCMMHCVKEHGLYFVQDYGVADKKGSKRTSIN